MRLPGESIGGTPILLELGGRSTEARFLSAVSLQVRECSAKASLENMERQNLHLNYEEALTIFLNFLRLFSSASNSDYLFYMLTT